MKATGPYSYEMKEEIIVGLTATDGWTVDHTNDAILKYGETKHYADGLGDGRTVIIYAKADNTSTQNVYDNVHVEAQAGG